MTLKRTDDTISADVVLLSKILNGKIDCPDMLSQILFRTPSATCSRDLFARQQHRTNHAANNTMYRLQRFLDSVPVLKRRIAGEVRAKKPSLTLNLGTNGLKVTSELSVAGQAGCMQGQDRLAITQPSSSHARRCLMWLSCDNCCTRYTAPLAMF
ncbi:hypothetical protein J6590_052754 [Homalodisca vitripennis]|nr:hypothetical protein J6590_052754 [Homalodisca vitripennis]